MKRSALALVVATLFFGRQIALWSAPGNRYLYHWRRGDAFLLIVAIVVTALVLLAADVAVRRLWGARGRRVVRWAFVFVVVQLVAGLLLVPNAERPESASALISPVAAVLVVAGLYLSERTMVRSATTACLVLSPLPLLLFVQMASWRPWRSCAEVGGAAGSGQRPGARPVFILVFDEWSFEHSWDGGKVRADLERLRGLADRSFVFTNARAPGDATYKSIPRMLYGDSGLLTIQDGRAAWEAAGRSGPASEQHNIFRAARSHGYATSLVGWYLPYPALVGDDLDWCRVYPQTFKRTGAAGVREAIWANLQFLPDPLTQNVWRRRYAPVFSTFWYGLQQRMEADALRAIGDAPDNALVFLHFPIPHAPFVFDADGRYRGPYRLSRMHGTLDDQARHLGYLDKVLGRLLDAMERSGKLDSALVVVTSDHGWKLDPDHPRTSERVRHVPLVVKWPGQRSGSSRPGELCLTDLGEIVEAAIGVRVPAELAAGILDGLESGGVGERCAES